MTISAKKIAYGPGKMDFHFTNVVRVSLLNVKEEIATDSYIQLETSIDDMSPEYLGTDFQEGLLKHGAIDFSLSQEVMKKGRFGFILKVILKKKALEKVSAYLFDHASTIGLRYFDINRLELPRKIFKKQTSIGEVTYKESVTPSGLTKSKPEFEDVKKIAEQNEESTYQIKNKLNNNQ